MSNVLEVYRRVQERWGLPHFEKLQATFRIEIEDNTNLEEIRNEISNTLFNFTERVIEPLLWSMHHSHIIEREMLSKDELQMLFGFYRQMQSLLWRNNMLSIKADDDQTALWIRDMWAFWKRFEQNATEICSRISKGWENLKFKNIVTEYHG